MIKESTARIVEREDIIILSALLQTNPSSVSATYANLMGPSMTV
jgi:hypothetical protein